MEVSIEATCTLPTYHTVSPPIAFPFLSLEDRVDMFLKKAFLFIMKLEPRQDDAILESNSTAVS